MGQHTSGRCAPACRSVVVVPADGEVGQIAARAPRGLKGGLFLSAIGILGDSVEIGKMERQGLR